MIYNHWSDYPADKWRWPSFSPEEMACRGTGKLLVHEPSMVKLQALRDAIGKPFIVNSAYRSPEHNRRVGGASRSQHLHGRAFDISMANHHPHAFEMAARRGGFNGIGTYPPKNGAYNFLHIDTRQNYASWGSPFPPDEPSFSEPAPRPATEKGKGALPGVIAGVGASATAVEAVSGLSDYAQWIAIGGVVLAAVVAIIVFRDEIGRLINGDGEPS